MAPTIPTSEPSTLSAGASWQWTRSLSEFPVSDGYAIKYYLTGKTSIAFAGTANLTTGVYDINVAPGTTDDVAAGIYGWILRASLAFADPQVQAVYDVDSGIFNVLANPNVAAATDLRGTDEILLAKVEAEIAARLPGTGAAVDQFSIGIREFQNVPLETLFKMRKELRLAVVMNQFGKLPDVEAHFVRA